MAVRKWLLYSLNLLIWFVTTTAIGICIALKVLKIVESNGLGILIKFDIFTIAIIIFLIIGLIAFMGMVGALRENLILLKTFRIIISLFLLLELVCVLLVALLSTKAENFLREQGRVLVGRYDISNHAQVLVDFFQITFNCCGADDISQYDDLKEYSCKTPKSKSLLSCGVPYSCCKLKDKTSISVICGANARKNTYTMSSQIYTTTCVSAIIKFIKANLITIGILIGCLVLFQFINIIICSSFINSITAIIAQYRAKVRRLR